MMANEEIDYKLAAEQLRSGKPLFGKDGALAPMLERILNPNRSLGPTSSGDIKVFSCSPESEECLPLVHGSHKT